MNKSKKQTDTHEQMFYYSEKIKAQKAMIANLNYENRVLSLERDELTKRMILVEQEFVKLNEKNKNLQRLNSINEKCLQLALDTIGSLWNKIHSLTKGSNK